QRSDRMRSLGSFGHLVLAGTLVAATPHAAIAQGGGRGSAGQDSLRAQRFAMEAQLESLAVVERKVMVPMRDGKRMQFDIYYPKNVTKAPAIFVRTPYQMNFWDIQLGGPASMAA